MGCAGGDRTDPLPWRQELPGLISQPRDRNTPQRHPTGRPYPPFPPVCRSYGALAEFGN
jgi:hypothetical protein